MPLKITIVARISKKRYQYRRGMAESSETSLRDAQILDGDGALANEAANKY